MSIATHTIETTHFASAAPPVRTTKISRAFKSEWTKLRTLPSTWRTTVIAVSVSIGLGTVLCISQANQWATMTAQERHAFDPNSLLVGRILPGRSRTARGAGSAGHDRRVLDGDDPVHLHCDTDETSGAVGQSCGRRRVRVSGGTGDSSRELPGGSGGLHWQAPPSLVRISGRAPTLVFAGLAISLVAIIGVGLGGLIRHTGATTALVLVIVGGAVLGQFLPAGLRQYLPGTALEAAVTVNHSAVLLQAGIGQDFVVLGLYAAIALGAASIRVAHRDA